MAGIPLIAHSIISAQKSKCFDKIIVSTDDEKIAKIAKFYKAEIPMLRPKKFAKDNTPTIDVIKNVVDVLDKQNYNPDIICILQPTSPFRDNKIIKNSLKLLKKNVTSVISVRKINHHPYASFLMKNKKLFPYRKDFTSFFQRQKFPDMYFPTGSIYTFWCSNLKKYDNFYGKNIVPIIVNDEPNLIDIDNKFDLFTAEMTSQYWKNFKKTKW